jgi:hypothetical protein
VLLVVVEVVLPVVEEVVLPVVLPVELPPVEDVRPVDPAEATLFIPPPPAPPHPMTRMASPIAIHA